MLKIEIATDSDSIQHDEDIATEVRRVAALIEDGFTEGQTPGGWWTLRDWKVKD